LKKTTQASATLDGGKAVFAKIELLALFILLAFLTPVRAATLEQTIREAQSKVVKIYGAGGLRGMEAYQTGILISSDGHVLTVSSYVLDTDDIAVLLDDGRKWQAELVGSDPVSELAILKLPVEDEPLPHFDLHQIVRADPGQRILALSNLYGIATGDEPVSVLQGVITTVAPLNARRGAFRANYHDQVYILDAYANNPGAAGGALIDWQGRLLGLLGKELRSQVTGTWLNYALPTESFVATVDNLLAGRSLDGSDEGQLPPEQPLSAEALGLTLVPNILERTPPYVDAVRRDSVADKAGLRPDDLIVFIANEPTASCRAVDNVLRLHDREERIRVSVLRAGKLVEFSLQADPIVTDKPPEPTTLEP